MKLDNHSDDAQVVLSVIKKQQLSSLIEPRTAVDSPAVLLHRSDATGIRSSTSQRESFYT